MAIKSVPTPSPLPAAVGPSPSRFAIWLLRLARLPMIVAVAAVFAALSHFLGIRPSKASSPSERP